MDHTRHINIYQVPVHFRVGLVGAGGIGATTALVLAKMGVAQLDVWDDDEVSPTNIPTQLHKWQNVGVKKIESLQQTLEEFSDEIFFTGMPYRLDENSSLKGHYDLFITAVDSITARQRIWGAVANASVDWLIDARMAAEKFDVFVVDMHDLGAVERYHAMLMCLNENDVPELNCTEKATFHCASAAAANIGAIMRNILRNEQESARIIHYIPQFMFHVFSL